MEEVERAREEEQGELWERVKGREIHRQWYERERRVIESKYNSCYKGREVAGIFG